MKHIPTRQNYFANSDFTQINRNAVETGLIAVLGVAANGVVFRHTYDQLAQNHASPARISDREFFQGVSDGESPYLPSSVRRPSPTHLPSSVRRLRFSDEEQEQQQPSRARRRLMF